MVFATSQYADVVLSHRGVVVYDWVRGKAFFQAFWTLTLRPHEVYIRSLGRPEEIDTDNLEPGRYELHAFLTSFSPGDRPLAEARRPFWVFDPGDGPPLKN